MQPRPFFKLLYDLYAFGDLGLYLVVLGKAALFNFGEGEFAVDGDFKTPAAGGNECEAFDILFELSQKSVRQTDGLVFVASSRAVFDVDSGHGGASWTFAVGNRCWNGW